MNRLPHPNCVRLLADVADAWLPAIELLADSDTRASIDQTIDRAKLAAEGDLPCSDLKAHADSATRLTGKLEFFSRGFFVNEADRESKMGRLAPEQLTLIRDVADVAARSLRAATGDESNANVECQEGLSWAYDMAERLGDELMLNRIQSLVDTAAT